MIGRREAKARVEPIGVAGPCVRPAVRPAHTSASHPQGAIASPCARTRPPAPLSRTFPWLPLPPRHFLEGVSLSFPSLPLLLTSEAQMSLKPDRCPPSHSTLDPWETRHDNSLTAAAGQPARGEAPRAHARQRSAATAVPTGERWHSRGDHRKVRE